MKFTFETKGLVFTGDTNDVNVNDVIDALETLEDVTITVAGASAPATTAAPVSLAEAVASFAEGVENETEGDAELSPVEEVYGEGFEYSGSEGQQVDFRQPFVGEYFLDPHPASGESYPVRKRKTTPTAYGPRIILAA